ncbi:MAG: lysophospholipid acyltransferase family protein [Pseudomonadota bacterium]
MTRPAETEKRIQGATASARWAGGNSAARRSVPRNGVAWFTAFLRTRAFEVYVVVMSLVIGLGILTYYQLSRGPRRARILLRTWSSLFIEGARILLGTRYRVDGLKDMPPGPLLFIGNHQSYWESIALTAVIPDINVISKSSAMKIPIFGWGLRYAPMIRVERSQPGQNLRRIIREAKASIADGRSVLIFPEATRVDPGKRRAFARGFELLYRHCAVPAVPVITNAGLHWTTGFATKFPGEITLRFLPATPPGQEMAAFATEIERQINREKDRLLPQRHC